MAKRVKKYELDTFEKLINHLNPENFNRLTEDLVEFLAFQMYLTKKLRDLNPKEYEGVNNFDVAKPKFTWVDDGKKGVDVLHITDPVTNKKKTIRLKTKK